MNDTFKLGNRCNCLIRAYNSMDIGTYQITYGNEPYTSIDNCRCRINFTNDNANASQGNTTLLRESLAYINEIHLYDCLLTTKILNLIFPKIEPKYISKQEKLFSDDTAKIYLSSSAEKLYQVFIYCEGQLEAAYGELENTGEPLKVKKAETSYLVVYQIDAPENTTTRTLNSLQNLYLTLDLEVVGNTNNETKTSYIHIDKCNLYVNKSIALEEGLNTVDLTFRVINTKDDSNYIIF